MYQLKSFVRIQSLIDNNVGLNSIIGEPSVWSLTYTKERGEYSRDDIPGFSLISLSSTDSVTGKVPVGAQYANHVLAVASWLFNYASAKGNLITRNDFYDDVIANYPGIVSDLNFGTFVNNNTLSLPEWVSWKNPALPDNYLKIWFSDTAFSTQFDETEIIVIPPMDNLDDFFLMPNVVRSRLEAQTISETIDLIQAAKQKNPETIIRTDAYEYKHPDYPTNTFNTYWSVLIYGIAGDNIDSVKDAITTYILANSTHTRDEWTVILPDLFKRTEFIILPRWDKYAIPNMTVQAGVYSPIISLKEAVGFAKAKVPEYPVTHMETYLAALGHPYKSLALLSIGSATNRDNKFRLSELFPDYINVGTSTIDFNRMDLATQNWSYLIEQMLITAEKMTEYSDVPSLMRRVRRGNMLYVAQVYLNVQYLVAAKINYGV